MRSHPLRSKPLVLSALLALTALALVLGAGEAAAATPIDLGASGEGPHMAISETGAASLTWANSNVLMYCRLDPGAGACSASHVFPEISGFGDDVGNAPLVVGSSVDVLSARSKGEEDKFLYFSSDGFASASTVGTTSGAPGSSVAFTQALFAAAGSLNTTQATIPTMLGGPLEDGAIFGATNTSGTAAGSLVFSRTPTNAPESVANAAVGLQGKTLVGAYTLLDSGEIYWRRYDGPASSTPANLITNSNWSTQAPIASSDDTGDMAITSGLDGIYIAYDRPGDDAVLVQRFNELTNSWEAPVQATEPGIKLFGISEDAAGTVHVAYVNQAEGVLHYTYGRDAGNTSFTRPQSLASGSIREPEVATTAAGTGWVTWRDADDEQAKAIPIAPGEPTVAPAPPAPPAAPSGGGGGTKNGAGSIKTTTKQIVPGLDATLKTPRACVGGGSAFKAKVAVKKKGSKAKKLSYTVKRVKFSVAGKPISTDTVKPFEATLHAGRRAGASIPVTARISVKLKKGHRHSAVTKTLTATVTSCG